MNDTLRLASSMRPALTLIFLAALLGLAGCTAGGGGDGDESSGGNGSEIVQATEEIPPGEQCPYGGVQVESGIDENGNGELDEEEVDSVQFVCNGAPGTLIATSTEPPGTNCPLGGLKLESGLDLNGNGVLDPEEVSNTNFLCNGGNGLVAKSPDPPAGPFPGHRILLSGGASPTGVGGDGGTFVANIAPGTITGHLKLFQSGEADASFAVPAFTPYLGQNPLIHAGPGTLRVETYPLGDDTSVSAGEVHTHSGNSTLWEYDGVSDQVVTGISVSAGATLVFAPNIGIQAPDTVDIGVPSDIHNAGVITVDPIGLSDNRAHLNLVAGRFHSDPGSQIFLEGVDNFDQGVGGAGGDLNLFAQITLTNQGQVPTEGGDGIDGGAGGSVLLSGERGVVNTASVSANGGFALNGTVGNGGPGGSITLIAELGDVNNSGNLSAFGGIGSFDEEGQILTGNIGDGNDITLTVTSVGVVRNSGVLSSDGGGGVVGNGLIGGGEITLSATCGGVINSGELSTDGGGSFGSGDGSEPGPISILSTIGSDCILLASELDVIVSGHILARGGAGGPESGNGAPGGTLTIGLGAAGAALGQELMLLGYDSITANGGEGFGDGLEGGGGGGSIFLINGFDLLGIGGGVREGGGGKVGGGGIEQASQQASQSIGVIGGAATVLPSGGVYNHVALEAMGGDSTGNGPGGDGGTVAMYANLELSPAPVFEVAANYANIVLNGGDGTASGGDTSQVLIFGRTAAENHGDITMDSGGGSDVDGIAGTSGGGGVGGGRTIQIVSGLGPALNDGGLYGRGGNATAEGGIGGRGHLVEIIGSTASNFSEIDTSGGAGGTSGSGTGIGGDAGDIVLMSFAGASTEAGSLLFDGGVGDLPGLPGSIYIDNADVTCDYDPVCNP